MDKFPCTSGNQGLKILGRCFGSSESKKSSALKPYQEKNHMKESGLQVHTRRGGTQSKISLGHMQSQHLDLGDESGCDVICFVGRPPEIWRIPTHASVLIKKSEYFRANLQFQNQNGGSEMPSTEQPIELTFSDFEPRIFILVLQSFYDKQVSFENEERALDSFQMADYFHSPDLYQQCVEFLLPLVKPQNAFRILSDTYMYTGQQHHSLSDSFEPSAPSMETLLNIDVTQDDNTANCWKRCEELLQHLRDRCWSQIDRDPEAAMRSSHLDDLPWNLLSELLHRQSLNVNCESVFLDALDRWSQRNCQRQNELLQPSSKRKVLQDVIYEVRLLTINDNEKFFNILNRTDLYTLDEKELLSEYRLDSLKQRTYPDWVYKMATQRNSGNIVQLGDGGKEPKKRKYSSDKVAMCVCTVLDKIF